VRLTAKFAERIDDVDLGGCAVGDVLDLQPLEARLLIAEKWAVPDPGGSAQPRRRPAEDELEAS
jgi:hypothetical protein